MNWKPGRIFVRGLLFGGTLGLPGCGATSPRSEPALSSGALIVTLGVDSLSVEEFRRTATTLEGRLLRRIPRTTITTYEVAIASGGLPSRAALRTRNPDGSEIPGAPKSIEILFGADSATVIVQRDSITRRRVAAANGVLLMPDAFATNEIWLARARRSRQDSGVVTAVSPLGGPAGRLAYNLFGDSARIWLLGAPFMMNVDADGRIKSGDGRATTVKSVVHRVPSVDLNAIAAAFAARERASGAMGVFISPRDTARAVIGGATILIDYGRPLVRGRNVFENGVLGDTLWRTGANAATQLNTDRALRFGANVLPPGKYTLWTRASRDNSRYELLFNSQSGQWGTQHDAAKDLFSIPLARRSVPHVELFTINVAGSGNEGTVNFSWGTTGLSASFEIAC